MSDTERPAHLRLYFDAVSALPLPGERMTVAAYEKIRDLLWDDVKAREPQDGEVQANDEKAEPEKPVDERPKLTAGSHLASSERRGYTMQPDTIAFGFGSRNW